jgi:glyoxylase-like metal-dependent hydrolase (beta-lactamase superfamily II)
MQIEVVLGGFPGRADRGFLGWSTVALLRGQGRNILFDTGGFGERHVLLERLAAMGVSPEDVDTIVLSHFHFDHAINFVLFPEAEVMIHERELAYAEANCHRDLAVPDEFLNPLKQTGRLRVLTGEEEVLPGVRVLETPGHTPGSISLLIADGGKPKCVLAGDSVKNLAELRTGAVAMSLDPEQSRNSITKIRRVADLVIPGHDSTLWVIGDRCGRIEPPRVTVSLPPDASSKCSEFVLEVL